MTRRALITGVTGQDGSFLAELLLSKGYEVYGVVRRLSTPNITNIAGIAGDITLIDADLTDQSSLNNALRAAQPTEIYNLAAQSFVETSFRQPVLTSDVTGTGAVRILEAMRLHAPDARFYQASTSELFGLVQQEPQTESTPFHPRSPYGFAKLMAYWAVINYRESYGLHASNGILFNHESERRGLEFVTRKISHGVAMIKEGYAKELRLGNLDALRDWGYAPEYVEGMWRMLQQPRPDDYVMATGRSCSVREFCQLSFEHAGISDWESYVKVDPRYYRPAEVHTLRGDASKAKRVLGWEPKLTVPDLVRVMVDADLARMRERKHLDGLRAGRK